MIVCGIKIHESVAKWEQNFETGKETWLSDARDWPFPHKILYRVPKKKCESFMNAQQNPNEARGASITPSGPPDSLEQSLQNARQLLEGDAGIYEWTQIHYDLLWFLMIEYGPKVSSSRMFATLASKEGISSLWPKTQTGNRDDVGRLVRDMLRNRYSDLALGALDHGRHKSKMWYSDESHAKVLKLLKEEELPKPKGMTKWLKKLQREDPDITYTKAVDDRLAKKEAEMNQENSGAEMLNSPPPESAPTLRCHGWSQYSQSLQYNEDPRDINGGRRTKNRRK